MDGIRIEVTGNIARVIEKPARITSGTVGLPVEFTFDSQWDGLTRVAVFRAGCVTKTIDNTQEKGTVPWEVLVRPDVWLCVGVYGTNDDGTIVIPTIWANVSAIQQGVTPSVDPSTDPSLPIWQEIKNYIESLTTKPVAKVAYINLLASAWVGADGLYSQVVEIDGVTEFSQVDLKPSAEQLAIFHEKDIAFSTENEDGVVTVHVIGDRPTNDYKMQVSITEVVV
jgi:hypothetical protein